MECQTLSKCLEEIRAYIDGNTTGFPLLINTQNYEDFNKLRESLESDVTMEKLYVSDMTPEGELPNLGWVYGRDFKKGVCALIGVSQGLMLRGAKALMEELRQLATSSFRGRMIILLSHCESYLRELIKEDGRGRLPNTILFWQGVASTLPAITVANGNETDKTLYLRGVKGLVYALERYSGIPADKEFIVSTAYSPFAFAHSLYPIKQEATPYERLMQKYPVLAEGDIDEKSGAQADWRWLSEELTKCGTVENLIERYFGDVNSLFWQLSKVLKETDEKKRWLYWLSLNIYPPKGNYFRFALSRGNSLSEFEKELYIALLDVDAKDENFYTLYSERKEILEKIPVNQKLIVQYCNNVGKRDNAAVYYLTDMTENERSLFLKYLSGYEYAADELQEILRRVAPELEIYLRKYDISENNTVAPVSSDILSSVSAYFNDYKKQKLTNKINPEFLQKVEEYAKTRPYNKFLTRLSLLNKVSEKSVEVFFFDALGVEYLSYIAAKCEELGLMTDIKIGRSELPSITSMNRDFYNYFKEENIHKIGELDECKHHSKKFDYQKCREPLHIFEELQIIDDEINKIYAKMTFEHIEKAVIVSDHGASRLAVINESENDAVVLSEKGEHSGRCAPAENDPEIPFATYENGYAVLANYDRFKGGRKADVEVHGGATLEEVLVPIIVLSLRPEKLEYSFAESEILFKPGQDAHLVLFCNAPMNKPQLKVGDKYYDGSFTVDKQHAEFYIEGARRKGKYNAEVYEGEVFSGISLSFEIKKQTQEDDLGI